MRLRPLAAILLFAAATGACATVYKVVGPDGRVSYTDQPLKASADNVHVFKGGSARPTSAAVANPQVTGQAGAPGPAAMDGQIGSAAGSQGGRGSDLPLVRPENAPLLPTVRNVLSKSILVRESMQLCMQSQPASTRRFEGTMEGWKTRNQEAIDAAEEVLATTVAPVPRIQLKQHILDRTRQTLRPLREGPGDERVRWCEVKTAEFAHHRLDPAQEPGLADLLRAYRR